MIDFRTSARAATLVLLAALSTAASAQTTLDVPTRYPTIQAAINAATAGDVIQVASGAYFERIDFLGKDIEVVGQGFTKTSISGGGLMPGSTVTFGTGETRAARLAGFTIMNGSGTHILVGAADKLIGGGILCRNGSSPTIEDCRVSNNILPSLIGPFIMYGGGGIAITGAGSNPLIRKCTIENNIVNVPTNGLVNLSVVGGGILVESGGIGEVEDCVIRNNEVAVAPGLGDGGGVGALSPLGLLRCRISGNIAGDGGGVLALGSSRIELCRILDNQAITGCGGGLALGSSGQATHDVLGCLVARNFASITGGGIFGTAMTMDHSTVTENTSVSNGGLHLVAGLSIIQRSIVWGNVPGGFCDDGVPIIDSNVQGATKTGCAGAGSSNVMDVDPMFLDPANMDYGIDPSSPIRDSVITSSPTLTMDIDGDPRMFCPLPDMGADEFYGFDDIAEGAVGQATGGPYDVLAINGDFGGIDRRVVLEILDPFSIDVLQPPTSAQPSAFIIFGFIGVPDPSMTQEVAGFGTLAIPVELITPGVPGVFTLTSSFGPVPTQLTSSTPAPWSTGGVGPPFPMKISLQGLIEETPGVPVVTNGVIMEYRL